MVPEAMVALAVNVVVVVPTRQTPRLPVTFTTGIGLMVNTTDENAGAQGGPSGLFVVSVSVTVPARMSPADGVYDVAVPNTLLGLKVPVPLVLHVAVNPGGPVMDPPSG